MHSFHQQHLEATRVNDIDYSNEFFISSQTTRRIHTYSYLRSNHFSACTHLKYSDKVWTIFSRTLIVMDNRQHTYLQYNETGA